MTPGGLNMMIPAFNLNNDPVKHVLTIRAAVNGWSVIVEEDIKLQKSMTAAEMQKMMASIMKNVSQSINGDDKISEIHRENDAKGEPTPDDVIKLGQYIFHKWEGLIAFQEFVFANQIKEFDEADKVAEKATKFNSQMQ